MKPTMTSEEISDEFNKQRGNDLGTNPTIENWKKWNKKYNLDHKFIFLSEHNKIVKGYEDLLEDQLNRYKDEVRKAIDELIDRIQDRLIEFKPREDSFALLQLEGLTAQVMTLKELKKKLGLSGEKK